MNIKIKSFKNLYAHFVLVFGIILFFIIYPFDITAQEFRFQWGVYGDRDGQFSNPSGIAIDSLNNVYVVDTGNNRVQKFRAEGDLILTWGSNGSGNSQFNSPLGIGTDSNDETYVVDTANNRIQKFDSNGTYITSWGVFGTGNGQFDAPQGVATDSDNDIYVTDSGNDRVQKFDNEGNFISIWGSNGGENGQFISPRAIAYDLSDKIWVSDSYDRIQIFDTGGRYLVTYGRSGTKSGSFSEVMGISTADDRKIYVSEFANIRVQKLFEDGSYFTKWGKFGKNEGEFDWPYGIAVTTLGEIYVVDSRNNRIQVFSQALSPTYPIHNPWWTYLWTNLLIVEENGRQCETFGGSSGSILIYQMKYGEVSLVLNGTIYRGFVSGNTYNVSVTEKQENSIITEQIIFSLASANAGSGKSSFAKTDNLGSYCMVEGNIDLTFSRYDVSTPPNPYPIGNDIPFLQSSSSGCVISSVVHRFRLSYSFFIVLILISVVIVLVKFRKTIKL